MEALFLKLVNMSITASWLVLAIIVVRLIFKKAPKWILCLLWGLVAFRLICPFSIESAMSLIPSAEPLPQEIIYTAEPQIHSGVPVIDNAVNPVLESSMTPAELTSANPTQIWSFILSQVWILGMVLMFAYTLVSYLLLKRKVATAIPLVKGIKQSEYVDSPFVLGIIRPVIYLPFSMEEGDMAYVIAHEKAHIRRRDHWWKPFGFLLLSVYWFNPVLWVAYILLCRDIEAACDEKVIKDMEKDERRAYSTALLNCSIHRRRIAACPLAFGETGVKARVKSVMNYKKPAFWVILIALLVSIIVAVCFLTNPKNEEEDTSGYDLIEMVTSQNGYSILSQERTKINLVIEKSKLPEDCYTLKGHTFEVMEVNPYQTFADNKLYLKHVGIDEERSEYLRFTFAFQTDALEKENLLLPYHMDAMGNGFVCNVEVNRGEVWDNQKTYENAAYFAPEITGEGFCVLVKKAVCESAGHHIAFMLNDMNRLTYEIREAVSPVTISLENVRPTGATILFHQNKDLIDGPLLCNYEYFLQQQVNGKWEDLPKKAEIQFPNQTYDIAVLHHNGVDWEQLYGRLPVGNYRLGKVIPITSRELPEYTTVYAEFSVDNVYTWFDRNSTDVNERSPKDNVVALFGMDGVSLSYGSSINEILLVSATENEPIISCDVLVDSAFLTDLTGDGIAEVCANVQTMQGSFVQVYDAAEKKLYELPNEANSFYVLTKKADRLCVLKNSMNWITMNYGQLSLNPGQGLAIHELDPEVRELTEKLVCIDIDTHKYTCLSTPSRLENALKLLRDLKESASPASQKEIADAQANTFDLSHISINYDLGEKTITFSENYEYVWEYGSKEGYRVSNPEAISQFVENITDGVMNRETSGEPFATPANPWDWCAGVNHDAISTAEIFACVDVTSNGSGTSVSTTNGILPTETLQSLIDIINKIPKEAFSDSGKTELDYRWFFLDQTEGNCAISMIDGVNQMAVAIRLRNGFVEMLLTDELDKALDSTGAYLDPAATIWTIRDPALHSFLENIRKNPPLIQYSIGAEYDWGNPIEFKKDGFSVNLRFIEGWEIERVENVTNSGVRCRPAGVTDGWVYFSYWPEDYIPVEDNRYIHETRNAFWTAYISYPSDVKTATSLMLKGREWSYRRYDFEVGDYVIINDGAGLWFTEYLDEIEDTISLSKFTIG